jgi:aryl-alcohol dehydrogenase-like predicted oxidoreductase
LAKGLLTGHWQKRAPAPGDVRAQLPRFQDENVEKNLGLVEALRQIANAKNITVAQLAIAWVMAQGEDIVPLIGARRRHQLSEALAALEVTLTPEDWAEVERAAPDV